MEDFDDRLIKMANAMNPVDWSLIDRLIEVALSDETKNELLRIRKSKYHIEEGDYI